MSDTTNNTAAPFDGTSVETFHFKERKDKGVTVEPKRESFTATIPAENEQTLLGAIFGEITQDASGASQLSDRGVKLVSYLARLHNEQVFSAAQKMIGDKLASFGDKVAERVAYALTPDVIDSSKLDLWTIAFREPPVRGAGKQFSDELVAEVKASFETIGATLFKKSDGTPASKEGIVKAADEIFLAKFKSTKSNKPSLTLFKERITVWFAALEPALQERYTGLTQNLIEKIDAYLNPTTESSIGKFE